MRTRDCLTVSSSFEAKERKEGLLGKMAEVSTGKQTQGGRNDQRSDGANVMLRRRVEQRKSYCKRRIVKADRAKSKNEEQKCIDRNEWLQCVVTVFAMKQTV